MKFIQFIKSLCPKFLKNYRFLRYTRLVTTPLLGSWNQMVNTGQLRSILKGKPVNRNGDPVPWFSFPAIHYLEQLDLTGIMVFEYGTGNSSLFWIRKGCTLRAVELVSEWADYVRNNTNDKALIQHEPDIEKYVSAASSYDNEFDIIVVDGAERAACARHAVTKIKKNGIIILDNSEAYQSAANVLRGAGLIQVDFIGPAPLVHTWQCTSFFFKREHVSLANDTPKWIPGMTVFPKNWKPV